MITKELEKAFNEHVAAEFYSAHLYLAMSAYLESIDLPGMARWMRVQYQEETFHGEKLFDYVIERDGRAEVVAFEAPPKEWKSVQEVFDEVLKHEKKVTSLINSLMDKAISENDHASQIFLQWYVNEQVEEEATAKSIVQQLKLLGDSKAGLFQIDRELGQRVFTPPVAGQE
jgi:ferritin